MTLRTLDSLGDLAGMRVFLRVDMNVPLHDGAVTDDSRIRASRPTIEELLERGAKLVVASHLGRPKGAVRDELRLAPVGRALAVLLGRSVTTLDVVTPEKLPDNDIERVLATSTSPALAADVLLGLALERGGRDNITVVVGRVAG